MHLLKMGLTVTDYKAIADADPTGDLQAAFETMRNQTVSSYRALTGNELRLWSAANPTDYSRIKSAAAADVVSEIAFSLIQTPDSLLELNRPEVLAMVAAMVAAGIVSEQGRDALLAMARVEVPMFPGLNQALLAKARAMRAEGRV